MAKILKPIQANAGIISYYRKRLLKEIKAMHKSVAYWLKLNYQTFESEIVQDARHFGSAKDFFHTFRSDMRKWFRKWNLIADWLAAKVITDTEAVTSSSLKDAFIAAGFSVKFDPRVITPTIQVLISENVSLIKSIPEIYFSQIEDIVTEGVKKGNDFKWVTSQLTERYNVARSRASFIARDQIDKANQTIQRTRDAELGITEGIWVHLPGQFTSRASHKAMNGKRFVLAEGLYDEEVRKKVKPGELPLCRCVYRRIIPDFGER